LRIGSRTQAVIIYNAGGGEKLATDRGETSRLDVELESTR
jgi:hypothetical protein